MFSYWLDTHLPLSLVVSAWFFSPGDWRLCGYMKKWASRKIHWVLFLDMNTSVIWLKCSMAQTQNWTNGFYRQWWNDVMKRHLTPQKVLINTNVSKLGMSWHPNVWAFLRVISSITCTANSITLFTWHTHTHIYIYIYTLVSWDGDRNSKSISIPKIHLEEKENSVCLRHVRMNLSKLAQWISACPLYNRHDNCFVVIDCKAKVTQYYRTH